MRPGDESASVDQLAWAITDRLALREFPGLTPGDLARLGADPLERADSMTRRELEAYETLERG